MTGALIAIAPVAPPVAIATLADEVRDYAEAAKAASTRRAYASDFAHFRAFCLQHGLDALPAASATGALYVASMARWAKVATIRRRLVSIAQAHKLRGLDAPTTHQVVREAMKGIARILGTAPDRKELLRVPDLRDIAESLPDTLKGARDRALLLLGFAGALRRSELVALDVDDVVTAREGLLVTIRRSKTDQEAAGATIGVPYGRNPLRARYARSTRGWSAAASRRARSSGRSRRARGSLIRASRATRSRTSSRRASRSSATIRAGSQATL